MNELRWILLAVGAAVIVVVWVLSTRRRPESPPELTEAVEPVLGDHSEPHGELVVLHVAADSDLDGLALFEALEDAGLEIGRMDIFHHPEGSFSVANILEPGTFGAAATPGVALFFELDDGKDASEAFERMLACARRLAEALDAEVLDDEHQPLTDAAVERIRESFA